MLSEIEKDSLATKIPNDSAVKKIAHLAQTHQYLEAQIAQAETDLADLIAAKKEIAEKQLPDAMDEAGVTAFELSNGSKITISPFYGATINDENRKPCYAWLESNGHAAIIKKTVSILLPRDDKEAEAALYTAIEEMGLDRETKEAVPPQTLASFVKEQVQGAVDFPLALFKVYMGRKAKIKAVK